jgi:hypothetical protein
LNLTEPKSFTVVKYLLAHTEASQLEISQNAHVALGHVNKIVNYLSSLGVVRKKSRSAQLRNPVRLLEIISSDRPFNKLEYVLVRTSRRTIEENEHMVCEACSNANITYGFTMFSGLRRFYEYHIAYPYVHAYVSDIDVEDNIEHGEGPVQIFLLNPDKKYILANSVEANGFRVCEKFQIIVDLFSSGIGKDAAMRFLEVVQHGDKGHSGKEFL